MECSLTVCRSVVPFGRALLDPLLELLVAKKHVVELREVLVLAFEHLRVELGEIQVPACAVPGGLLCEQLTLQNFILPARLCA